MGVVDDILNYVDRKTHRLDLTKPRYDQDSFVGRYKTFFGICNPIQLLKTDKQLEHAKDVVTRYKKGEDFPDYTDDQIWDLKTTYESAYHPVTDEKMFALGRMAAQSPMNMIIMGAMLVFYKKRSEVIFWQWTNQSYNALVNQINSSDPKGGSLAETAKSYVTAVGLALASSLYLNSLAAKAPVLAARLVPFGATSLSNAINIPLVRQKELIDGIQLWYDGKPVAKSRKMAIRAISEVVLSRIVIAVPHMVFIPIVMTHLERTGFLKRNPIFAIPFQFLACGGMLFFSTPLGCAVFPQKRFVDIDTLEKDVQEQLKKIGKGKVYYNKGL